MMARQVRHQEKVSFDGFYSVILLIDLQTHMTYGSDMYIRVYISKLWVGMNSGPICIFYSESRRWLLKS